MSEKNDRKLSFIAMMDNGGRRLWVDRRKLSVPISFPDRRSGRDRRSGLDRRGRHAAGVQITLERRKKLIQPQINVTDSGSLN